MSLALASGCGRSGDSGPAAPPAESADMQRGELLSYACQACHTFDSGGKNQVGPNLYGVFGRAAGTVPDFDYSTALEESGIVWSADLLDQWLADPAGFLPGTTMTFTGYQSPEDRALLIEYLMAATGGRGAEAAE